ncbi:MAG: hypothetical protein H7Z41_11745 [Cytophagales bacterium]|nr:hypothetical protein [Armatimonadota bacterium]
MRSTGKKAVPKPERRECDLAAPVQDYLEANGYTVRSEVRGCDITAIKDDDLIVIELKKGFTTDLLIQATDRQKMADSVYVALPAEGDLARRDRYAKRWRSIEHLLKRLEIGLMIVTFPTHEDAPATVEVLFHPVSYPKPRRSAKTRRAVLREIAGRSANYNVGGSTGRKLVTAYREQAVFIACCLDRFGPMTPTRLRALGAGPKAQNILFRNVYDWFDREGRGVYALRPRGRDEIAADYAHLAAHCCRRLEEQTTYRADAPPAERAELTP